MLRLLLFPSLLGLSLSALAKPLSDVHVYRRCYAHLAGEAPPLTNSLLIEVKNKTKSGVQACESLLELMAINPSHPEGVLQDPSNPFAKKSLNHMYSVFRGFSKITLQGNIANLVEDFTGTEDIYDITAVSLAYTENLFNPNRQFKELFSITRNPVAKREIDSMYSNWITMKNIYGGTDLTPVLSPRGRHNVKYFSDTAATIPVNPDTIPLSTSSTSGSNITYFNQNIPNVQIGELVGIHYNSPIQPITIGTLKSTNGISLGFDMNATLGKGVMGLRTYLMANANFSINIQSNLEFLPRRLSQALLRDFMCRELPVVREKDILSMVSSDPNAIAFRKASSCVACHATMDQMAGTFRGLRVMMNGDRTNTILHKFAVHPELTSVINGFPSEAGWPAIKDNDFYKRPQKGRFLFRTYDGRLIDQPLNSYSELVDAMTNTNDIHVCTAKKLFKNFTGVDVMLFDAGNPAVAKMMEGFSKADWQYRNFVVQLGLNLKKHQSLKEMIREIIKSPYYQQSDYGMGVQ